MLVVRRRTAGSFAQNTVELIKTLVDFCSDVFSQISDLDRLGLCEGLRHVRTPASRPARHDRRD